MKAALLRQQSVFGACDGVTIVLGLLITLTGHPSAIVKAAVGAGIAELVGMTAGAWLSDSRAGFWPALTNGAAAFAGCLVPALPYLALSGWLALSSSLLLVCAVAGAVAWLRPERGVLAIVQTYGVLAVAAVLCFGASLI